MTALIVILLGLPSWAWAQIRLAAVGDLMFGRYIRGQKLTPLYSTVSPNPAPLAEIAPVLRQADVVLGNLETPIMPEPSRLTINQSFTFRADPDRVDILSASGINVLSLANNHVTNLGTLGPGLTRKCLLERGLQAVGAGVSIDQAYRPLIKTIKGIRIAFLAYTLWHGDHPSFVPPSNGVPGGSVAYLSSNEFLYWAPSAVHLARKALDVDFVVVSLHFGVENSPHPEAIQRMFAYSLIDAGADVILGHHPHVLQDFERYKGGVIAYSLGNFLFDNPGLSKRQTVILQVTLSGKGAARRIDDIQLIPVQSDYHDQVPRLARGSSYQALAERLRLLAPGFAIAPPPGSPPSVSTSSR